MSRNSSKKQPLHSEQPPGNKTPRANAALADAWRDEKPSWRFRRVDTDGPWCWTAIGAGARDVRNTLAEFENAPWRIALAVRGNHSVEVADLCKKARDRLTKLGLQDHDTLYSLHITGRRRVWGYREGSVLHLLWWDPEHEVCPSLLKHT